MDLVKLAKVKILYQRMADLTNPECAKCQVPYSCCLPKFCELTMKIASECWGVELQPTGNPIPLLGPHGCIAEPYLRPHCTLHTCAVNTHGRKPDDEQWNRKYFALKSEIDNLTNLTK